MTMTGAATLDRPTLRAYELAHAADLHAGHEAYEARTATGLNVRGRDTLVAIHKAFSAIIAQDLPLVILPGDLFDKPNPNPNYVLALLKEFERLAQPRPDGSIRQIVICDGNHDDHYDKRRTSVLQYLSVIKGVHVESRAYKQVFLDPAINPKAQGADERLWNTVVHCLPHDSLQHLNEYNIDPVEGYSNILMTHGVAQGSKLFLQVRGREFAIPLDLMLKAWDYIALGHWHKQGPVQLGGGPEGGASKAWYAGSTENIGFGDLKGIGESREKGWLKVVVIPGQMPVVEPQKHPVRPMMRLPHIDAKGLDAEQIVEVAKDHLRKRDIADAIVLQQVINCPREVWAGVDRRACERAAGETLHYEIRKLSGKEDVGELENSTEEWDPTRGLTTLVKERVEQIPQAYQEQVMELITELLSKSAALPEIGAQ